MSQRVILATKSLVDTLLFDVIEMETRTQVTIGGAATRPEYDLVLFPSGLGFGQSVEVVTGETIDYVINQVVNKRTITLTLGWKGVNAYSRYQSFAAWVAQYFNLDDYHIRLSYDVGTRRYVEVAVESVDLHEQELNYATASVKLKPLTPFYEPVDTVIMVATTSSGKVYNYAYPYVYGGGAYSDGNTITNNYLKPTPLKIVLHGPMSAPFVQLTKITGGTQAETPYAYVSLPGVSLPSATDTLTIDAYNNRIYTTIVSASGAISVTDVFNEVDKSHDAFLLAEPGESAVAASVGPDTGACEVSFVRYVL